MFRMKSNNAACHVIMSLLYDMFTNLIYLIALWACWKMSWRRCQSMRKFRTRAGVFLPYSTPGIWAAVEKQQLLNYLPRLHRMTQSVIAVVGELDSEHLQHGSAHLQNYLGRKCVLPIAISQIFSNLHWLEPDWLFPRGLIFFLLYFFFCKTVW